MASTGERGREEREYRERESGRRGSPCGQRSGLSLSPPRALRYGGHGVADEWGASGTHPTLGPHLLGGGAPPRRERPLLLYGGRALPETTTRRRARPAAPTQPVVCGGGGAGPPGRLRSSPKSA